MTAPEEGPPTGGGGSVFTRKLGPFPTWVWMGLGLAAMLAYSSITKNKKAQAAQANSGTLPTTQTASGSTPASLIPQFVNQVYNQESPPTVNLTNNVTTPATTINNTNGPTTITPPATPPPPSATPPPSSPPPPAPAAGNWVTVAPWTSTNAPWNSTLWGIAQHFYGNGALYPKIFSANKSGVMRPNGTPGFITNPDLIHPGDQIWVPA